MVYVKELKMNQRIFELIQAQNGFNGLAWTEQDKQEFAELIVKECIAKVEEAAEYSPELYGVALDIAEHFGVDE